MPNSDAPTDVAALERLSYQTIQLAVAYRRNSEDSGVVHQLLEARHKLAEVLERLRDAEVERLYRGVFGKVYHAVLATDVRAEKSDADSQGLLERLELALDNGWAGPRAIQNFLALSLYRYAHEIPQAFDLPHVPSWFTADFVAFTATPPPLFRDVGEADAYLGFMHRWMNYLDEGFRTNPNNSAWRQAVLVFVQRANLIPLYFNEQNVKDVFSLRADLIEKVLRMEGRFSEPGPMQPRPNSGPIRIGILALIFQPSAESAASLPLYEHLDPSEFEVTLYCIHSNGNPMEQYCRSRAKALKVLPQSFDQQVAFLRGERLDILFFATNIAALTNFFSLLAAHRLAKVQATSPFSIVTTGFRHMDYYVSGTWTDPSPQAQDDYRERLIQMDGSVHCFSNPVQMPSVFRLDRAGAGIDPSSVVFASVANMHKLRPELLHIWAKILAQTPDSVLLLFPYGPNWSDAYPKRTFLQVITEICSEHGVGAERLCILGPTPPPTREDIREVLRMADVYLDSFPFTGSTSLIEPLEIGLPVVVKAGQRLRESMSAAMMLELNMPELIAADEESYIALAVELGRDVERRHRMGAKILQGMAAQPRFLDSVSFAARIAPIYRRMLDEASIPSKAFT